MQTLTNHHSTEQTLTDNDDIRELIAIVDSDFDSYNEISFNESISHIRQKWPLLQEIQQQDLQQQATQSGSITNKTTRITRIKLA
ncbi:MAG: hypothetical protein HRT35_27045 [Algicola sp.]|nr:hypothetical protein [Algicola sp.]